MSSPILYNNVIAFGNIAAVQSNKWMTAPQSFRNIHWAPSMREQTQRLQHVMHGTLYNTSLKISPIRGVFRRLQIP